MSELVDDDALVDDAIKMGAIHFIRQSVVASQHFHQEVYSVRVGVIFLLNKLTN